jgi:pantothenate kinase
VNRLVDQLADDLRRAVADRRLLLGIAGPPGSGKSTFAALLADALNQRPTPGSAAVLPMDGFHLTNAALDRLGLRARKGAPATFDVEGFLATLLHLRSGHEVTAPMYDRRVHEPVPGALTIAPGVRIVLVEGNYLLLEDPPWDRVAPLLDAVWYLAVPLERCMNRVRARHLAGGCPPDQADRKVELNDRPNARLVESARGRADLVIHPPLD